jgi:hypothetical protein
MFKIFSYQGNANQNHIEILFHISQHGSHQENKQQQMLVRMGGTFIHCWCKSELVQPLWLSVYRFLKKMKIELPYGPAIYFWVYTQRNQSHHSIEMPAHPCLSWHYLP